MSAGFNATSAKANSRIGGDIPRRINARRTMKSVAMPATQATNWAIWMRAVEDCHGLKFQSIATDT